MSAPAGAPPTPAAAAGPRVGRPQFQYPNARRATPEEQQQIAQGKGALPAHGLNRYGVDGSGRAVDDRNGDGMPDNKEPGYGDVLDRWYNPWTTQQTTERGEESLKGWGQTAMGIGAGAAATAAAVPVAAAAGLTAGAGGAMTAGGTAATLGTEVGLPVALEGARQMAGGTEPTTQTAQTSEQTTPASAAQTTASSPQPSAEPAAPKTPEQKQQANTDLTVKLNDPNVPDADKKQFAQQHVQQMLDSNPEMKQGMADMHAGKDTPQAKAFKAEVDKAGNAYIREEFARLKAENPGASAQQQGGFLQSAMQGYQSMPEPMKWMMGLGLGGGLIGILGSLFGGGGGMGMLGLLGLGAAGLAGAAGGMFGGGAQNFMADTISGIGKSTGMMPEKLTDQQKQILLAKDPVAHIKGVGGAGMPTRANAASQVAAGRQQLGQIQMLNSMGGMTPRMLESMGLSPEEAAIAAQNVGVLSGQYADQNSELNQHLQRGENYSKPGWGNWAAEMTAGNSWLPWNWDNNKTSADYGYELANSWVKAADEKATQEWMRKFRARGQGGRWVNTRRGSKTEKRVTSRLQPAH